jgi:hypothetical protein
VWDCFACFEAVEAPESAEYPWMQYKQAGAATMQVPLRYTNRESRRSALLAGAAVALLVLAVGAGLQDHRGGVVVGSAFTLVDRRGLVRIHAEVREGDGPSVAFYDLNKVNRMTLNLKADGSPGIALFDKEGSPRLGASLGSDSAPEIAMFDEAHRNLVSISIVKGRPVAVLFGQKEEAVGMRIGPDSTPQVLLTDKDAVSRLRIRLDEGTGKPSLIFMDKHGKVESRLTEGPIKEKAEAKDQGGR